MIGGLDIYDKRVDLSALRKNVGMVFQKPNPFPMSVYDNVAYGPRTFGIKKKSTLDEIVERSLKQAAISSWSRTTCSRRRVSRTRRRSSCWAR